MVKKIIILVLFVQSVVNLTAQTVITVEGNVSGTWNADTVKVLNDIGVPFNETLTIAPGTIVKFMGFYSFDIRGSIVAQGTSNDSILFTINDTVGFSNILNYKGAWNQLLFNSPASSVDSSIFEYCRFEYSKTDTVSRDGGVFYVKNFNKLRISHCYFQHNKAFRHGGAIYCLYSDIRLQYNTYMYNHGGTVEVWGYGGAVYGINSTYYINQSVFRYNTSSGLGGACGFDSTVTVITNNIFDNNFSPLGGAFGILRTATGGLISNNLISNNSCTFFGGGVALIETSPLFINNTVVANHSMYAGGLYCNDAANPMVVNSIFYSNTALAGYGRQVFILDSESQPKFYNSCFEHGAFDFHGAGFEGVYQNCLEVNPLFDANGEYPFALTPGSPCVNEGLTDISGYVFPDVDLALNPRIFENTVDMGAYECQLPAGIFGQPANVGNLAVWYSKSDNELTLQTTEPLSNESTIGIYNTQGIVVCERTLQQIKTNGMLLNIRVSIPVGGIYLAVLKSGNRELSCKFVVGN